MRTLLLLMLAGRCMAQYDVPEYTQSRSTAGSAYTFSKYTFVTDSGSTSVASITSPAIILGSGDFVVVSCRTGTASQTVTVTSSPANTFTQLTAQSSATVGSSQMSYALTVSSGSTTFTCTPSASSGFQSMVVLDYTHTGASAAFDAQGGSTTCNAGAGTNQCQVASFSTAANVTIIQCGTVGSTLVWSAATIGANAAVLRGVSSGALANNADQGCQDTTFNPAQTGITAALQYSSTNLAGSTTVASFK